MKCTPLYERHVRDASAVINLKGFARAMHYRGHAAEHHATREGVTLCDVSHMGELDFRGPDALALVQRLITNDASRLAVNQVLYSAMCNDAGGIIDDLLCYRLAVDHFVWVVNVTRTDEDFQWALRHAQGLDVTVSNVATDTALLALQGPQSREVLQRVTRDDLSGLRYYWLVQTSIHTRWAEVACMVSRTGYTGERGYEIMVARDLAPWVWDELLLAGQPLGIVAHGVAARESLRTEAGYLLNGNDMDRDTNPYEAGIGWVVKLDKAFIGRDALARIRKAGLSRKMVGFEVDGPRTVRNGCRIYADGAEIGRVTSGPLPPVLAGRNLGLGYVGAAHAADGTRIEIDIRGRRSTARIVPMPFRPRRVREEPAVRTHSPFDLRFSDHHVWARAEDGRSDVITLGITDFGQRNLGDILCLELPQVGETVAAGAAAAWGDTYRRAFDLVSPVSGEIVEVSAALAQHPAHVNAYPYATHGVVKVRVESAHDYERLMRFERYADLVRRLQRYDEWTADQRTT
jgi:aminomethyltransferase